MTETSENGVLQSSPNTTKNVWKKRAAILTKFVGIQTLVQLVSLLAGLLVVRKLTPQDYAFFTLVGTMQGAMTLLSDSGVGSALSAIGGKVWEDNQRFGQLINSGMKFRQSLFLLYGLLVVPTLIWMLMSNGLDWPYILVVCCIMVASAYFQLSCGVFQVVLRLRTKIASLQRIDFICALMRVVSIGLACLLHISLIVAIMINMVSFAIQYYLTRSEATNVIDLNVAPLSDDLVEIKKSVQRLAPTALFYCIQSQLTVFILSLYGSTRSIADVGALGRLAVIFSIFGSVTSNVVLPHFARCQNPALLKRMYWQILGAATSLGLTLIFIAWIFPTPLLWVLGGKYAHLETELVYVMFNAVVSMMGGIIAGLNHERSWTKGVWTSIPLIIGVQVCLIPLLDLSSVKGVVLLNCVPFIFGFLPFFYRAYTGLSDFQAQFIAAHKESAGA